MGPGESGNTTGIWAISIFGGPPRKLREDAGRAAVSPDGTRIAFITSRLANEIWIMGTSGEQPRKLLEGAPDDRLLQLQWSPDGARIAFLKSSADNARASIDTQPVAGGVATTVLTRAGLRSFCWLSDDRVVVSLEEPPPNDRDMNLWQFTVDHHTGKPSGDPQRLTSWAGLSVLDLSATADATRLVFVNSGFQADVYVGEIESRGALADSQRITLNERNDFASAWSPDGQYIYFWSDRNGNADIFRQRWQSRTAEEVVLGPGEQTSPRLSPDGSWLLYWDFLQNGNVVSTPMRLLRVSVSRGTPEPVLEARPGAMFRCAVSRPMCMLSEPDEVAHEILFTAFRVTGGRVGGPTRIASPAGTIERWDLSPDGSRLALVGDDSRKGRVRLIEVESGSSHDVTLPEGSSAEDISWAADGSSLLVATSSVRGYAILRLHLDGRSDVLWTGANAPSHPVLSPDGKRLAFSLAIHSSNAWMIENF